MSDDAKPTWTHPVLGTLTRDFGEWTGEIRLPSFAIFDSPIPVGRYELVIDDGSQNGPDPSLVEAALEVADADRELADNLLQSLWNQLMGISGDSEWGLFGSIPDNAPYMAQFRIDPPQEPQDLAVHIDNPRFRISTRHSGVYDDGPRIDVPEVRINFDAFWDPEHGLGFLVKGSEVLGIGCAEDVRPFGGYPPRTKPILNPFTGETIPPPDTSD